MWRRKGDGKGAEWKFLKVPLKKRKLNPSAKRQLSQAKTANGREKSLGKSKKLAKNTILIPDQDHDDLELSDQEFGFIEEYGDAISFLNHLDHKGIARSKREVERLHRLNKPHRAAAGHSDLPSLDSDTEDDDDSGLESESETLPATHKSKGRLSDVSDSDTEMPYEQGYRQHHLSKEPRKQHVVESLPIKLADGRLQRTGAKQLPISPDTSDEDDNEQYQRRENDSDTKVEDVSTGARFGRPAIVNVICQKSRKLRIMNAKEQIASICQEIIADPENSLGLLRRLHTFSLKEISSPNHPEPVQNDNVIRKLAILSQLAVFKDIIPGYRIRALTEKEKEEKVSQIVAHLRDWEQGLVAVYQNYLRCLDVELKGQSELVETALKCICTLLTDVTHFNFRVNLMACIVARLSRKSWNEASEMCLDALISVFRADLTGVASLEIVRLLNRMIKEKRFQIHPKVLSCLLHLRLKSELNVRASNSKADKATPGNTLSKGKAAARRAKGKATSEHHISKRARKTLKERKEIEKELHEAEAQVDREERAAIQTETLKLLFTLYFRVLKNPAPTPLLPAALHGISKFAHLVNVDFFKDLMAVLKRLLFVDRDGEGRSMSKEERTKGDAQQQLLCIVTAFELLSGQGEALNMDLGDFVTQLYTLILPLGSIPDIDSPMSTLSAVNNQNLSSTSPTLADMLFRALNIVFSPRTFGTTAPPWRSAAFAKRLLTATLNWSSPMTHRTLEFVGGLISREPKLEALLSTEDRVYDGVYRLELDDPQLCHPFGTCFWELFILHHHWDERIRQEAHKITQFVHK
ncbi:hypothetical protein AMATHDRAFT_72874 [Amanita thiersii Skay4041]|uniref:Nucleolar complex-associated protein 3 n=1 Tax=Amanita thiersii Skay4041 TaxID=703135 RepID=A0A2A9P161_9AGAR|nr:hypothetical protein AMATHDRAFT_72874 [Amanita thiersii Skay4041]